MSPISRWLGDTKKSSFGGETCLQASLISTTLHAELGWLLQGSAGEAGVGEVHGDACGHTVLPCCPEVGAPHPPPCKTLHYLHRLQSHSRENFV